MKAETLMLFSMLFARNKYNVFVIFVYSMPVKLTKNVHMAQDYGACHTLTYHLIYKHKHTHAGHTTCTPVFVYLTVHALR